MSLSLPLDRTTVRQYVGFAVREVIINCTRFSQENYHSGIIPSAAYPNGFSADLPNWDRKLVRMEGYLWDMDPAFKVLNVTISDSEATLNQALHFTSDRLTDTIISRNNQE